MYMLAAGPLEAASWQRQPPRVRAAGRDGQAAATTASLEYCQGLACAATPTNPSGQTVSTAKERTSEPHLTDFQVCAVVLQAVPGSLQGGSLCSRGPVVHSHSLLLVHCLLAGLQQTCASALQGCEGDSGWHGACQLCNRMGSSECMLIRVHECRRSAWPSCVVSTAGMLVVQVSPSGGNRDSQLAA